MDILKMLFIVGTISLEYSNATKQKNVDFLIKILDNQGKEYFIAFDHKVKDLHSCIKDIQNHGFKYSVFTLGDIQDQTFYENPSVKQQLSGFDFGKILTRSNYKSVETLSLRNGIDSISTEISEQSLIKKTLDNISEFEKTGNKEVFLKSPLMPVLLVNSQDIKKKILELQIRQGIKKFNTDIDDF